MHSASVNPSENSRQETLHHTREEHEVPCFIPNHTTGEVWRNTALGCCQSKEEMLSECDRIYGPLLKVMKLLGIYFGESSLKKMAKEASVRKKRLSFSFSYCLVIAASLWFNFTMASTSLFLEGICVSLKFFVQLTACFWSLMMALSRTICLVVLSLTEAKTSRFEAFFRNLVESNTDLRTVKSSSTKILISTVSAWVLSCFTAITFSLLVPWTNVGNNYPWNEWYGFTVVQLIIASLFLAAAWLLPVALVCITCLVHERLFDEFCKRVVPNNISGVDVGALREEHRKLCGIVELASMMLSPLLFVNVGFFIPLLCFEFYAVVNPPLKMNNEISGATFLLGALYWLVISAGTVAMVLIFRSRVNVKTSPNSIY